MKWAIVASIFYLIGMLIMYSIADFNIDYWSEIYYTWDKTKDVLFLWAIYQMFPKVKRLMLYPLIFSFLRAAWEIIAWVAKIDINTKAMVNSAFLFITIGLSLFLTIEFSKWRRQKS